jgi:NAD(P)H-dependent flavin oxidoreductase YrpB (nitropropane dioxygenase family)
MTLRTRVTELLGVEHPVILGGMGSGATVPGLVAAVSDAGGLGILGCTGYGPERIAAAAADIRSATERPFGLNLLLFSSPPEDVAAVAAQAPPVFATAWPWPEQDLSDVFERAHGAGCTVMHQVSGVDEAKKAVEAGADVIVAQGTEGGGHVGLMSTFVLVPMVARAVQPVPVVAAGGIATGAQVAAVLTLGAEAALLGTRFLATEESPWPPAFKRAIVESDGHDTELTEIPDIARARVWPGAFDRAQRNRLIEEWAGRESQLRQNRATVGTQIAEARASDDASRGELNFGQAAGLIDAIEPAGEVVRRLAREAETALASRSPVS